MQLLLQSVLDGILLGGVYATLALGLSIVYGIMHIINWAVGETLMLGMYLAFVLVTVFGMDPYVTILFTFTILGALGFFMQKFMVNNIINRSERPGPNVLLFTAGYGFIASSIIEIIFGTLSVTAKTRYSGLSILLGNSIYAPVPKLISCIIAVSATLALYVLMNKTEIGRAIRATSQDRNTAQLMGINSNLMYCIGFGLSFALLGLTASLLIPYYPITPYVGLVFSFKAFIIVVIGGHGNILGALAGGMFVGLVEKVVGAFVTDSFAQILVFCLFITVLLVRPGGLTNIRAAVSGGE
jgi:branched-chain amino acid transport system permease protein